MSKSLYDEDGIDGPFNKRMDATPSLVVDVRCAACAWCKLVATPKKVRRVDGRPEQLPIPLLLKKAWSIGLEHAWDNRGHVVETFVDGKLKATQQVAEMSPWKDHNAVVVEEGVE